mgnify:FL=1
MAARLDRSIKTSIVKQLQRDNELMLKTRNLIQKEFKVLHNKMMKDFESHPVTRELKSGPNASSSSGLTPRGNLFSFIGFNVETDPLSTVESLLQKTEIILKRRSIGTKGLIWTYIITAPSLNDLYKATPMPWAKGLSWLREMEGGGIPNLGQYIFKRSSKGRSGTGIQNSKISGGGRVKTSYIKSLLNNFEKDLNSIQASRVSKSYF